MEWGIDEGEYSCENPPPMLPHLKRIERRELLVTGNQAIRRTHVEQYNSNGALAATSRSVDVTAGEWQSRRDFQEETVERAKSAVLAELPQYTSMSWLGQSVSFVGYTQPTVAAKRRSPCEPPRDSIPNGYELQNKPVETSNCTEDSVAVNVPLLADASALGAIRSAFATMPRYEVRARYDLVPVLWVTPGVWVTLEGQNWYVEQVVLERTPEALRQSVSVVRWIQ
jgi:hypothetical protein